MRVQILPGLLPHVMFHNKVVYKEDHNFHSSILIKMDFSLKKMARRLSKRYEEISLSKDPQYKIDDLPSNMSIPKSIIEKKFRDRIIQEEAASIALHNIQNSPEYKSFQHVAIKNSYLLSHAVAENNSLYLSVYLIKPVGDLLKSITVEDKQYELTDKCRSAMAEMMAYTSPAEGNLQPAPIDHLSSRHDLITAICMETNVDSILGVEERNIIPLLCKPSTESLLIGLKVGDTFRVKDKRGYALFYVASLNRVKASTDEEANFSEMELKAKEVIDLEMLKSIEDKIYELLPLTAFPSASYLSLFQEDVSFKIFGSQLSDFTRRTVDKIYVNQLVIDYLAKENGKLSIDRNSDASLKMISKEMIRQVKKVPSSKARCMIELIYDDILKKT